MEKEFRAKTVDEAKALAAQEFGVSVDDIDFDILEQPKKSLFGYKGEARLIASYTPAQPEKPAEEVCEEAHAVADDTADAAEASEVDTDDEEAGELPEDFDVNSSAKVKLAVEYLTDVLKALGMENFTITPVKREGNVVLDIAGEKLGAVIGKRGETLDRLLYY